MKSYFGMFIIAVFYVVLGVVFNTKPQGIGWVLVLYPILIALCVYTMILVKRKQSTKILIIWILVSTIPTGLYAYYTHSIVRHSGGFLSFSWDFLLWELIMPFFVGASQCIMIIALIFKWKKQRSMCKI